MSRILVTPRSLTAAPGEALRPLQARGFELVLGPPGLQPNEAELLRLVPGCSGWLAGVELIGAKVLEAADKLKVISRNGSGIDAIDLAAAKRRGIKVVTAAGANARSVAELALAFILAGLRSIPASAASMRVGRWERGEGREIAGTTVGIIGCGAVGQALAGMVAALGGNVLAHDVAPRNDLRIAGRFSWSELDQLLTQSDVVSLNCPALPDGRPLLDAGRLILLKRGAGLVNTARASLLDEDALLAALDEGRVGWLATDVFATEPPPPSALLSHERVIATPHIGGLTAEGGREAVRMAVENLIAELGAGERRRVCEDTEAG